MEGIMAFKLFETWMWNVLYLIFALFVIMITWTVWQLIRENREARMTIFGDTKEINEYIAYINELKKGGGYIKKHWDGKW